MVVKNIGKNSLVGSYYTSKERQFKENNTDITYRKECDG